MKSVFSSIGAFFKKADMLLLLLCVAATVFGIVIISSATAHLDARRYVIVQSAALVIGIFLYILFTLIDIDIIAERKELLMIFNCLFLCTLFVWGVEGSTGNRSWLSFRWLPFNIQPAEICKTTFIIVLAKIMSVYRSKISSPTAIFRMLLPLILMVGLILASSDDAGVALIFVFVFLIMTYCGGVNIGWFLAALAAVAVVVPVAWNWPGLVRADQKARILMFFDPTIDPAGTGVRWQTNMSLSYLQRGGLTGLGLYTSPQTRLGTLPAQHTDFIFSVVGEELGIVGCIFLLILLGVIVARCLQVGSQSGNYMNRLICTGIAGMLIFQIAVNVGMCLGVFPVIGLTLPFISYGGSSIVTMFASMGIVSGIRMRPAPDNAAQYIRLPQ